MSYLVAEEKKEKVIDFGNLQLEFEQETDIAARIEKVRIELYRMIGNIENNNFSNDDILELSQYLDKLLVKYIKDYRCY